TAWSSARRWSPCPTSLWGVRGDGWRPTGTCATRAGPPDVRRGGPGRRRRGGPRLGPGRGSGSAGWLWRGARVPWVRAGSGAFAPPSRRAGSGASAPAIGNSLQPPPARRPVPAKPAVPGAPQATTPGVGSSAPCAPGRWWPPSARVHSRPRAPRAVVPDGLPRAVVAGGRRGDTHAPRAKGLLIFLSTWTG